MGFGVRGVVDGGRGRQHQQSATELTPYAEVETGQNALLSTLLVVVMVRAL